MTRLMSYLCGALLATFAFSAAAPAVAQLPPEEAFRREVRGAAEGDVVFTWSIADGHYLYRAHTVATDEGDERLAAVSCALLEEAVEQLLPRRGVHARRARQHAVEVEQEGVPVAREQRKDRWRDGHGER